jgi:hypothetical protein
MGNCSSVTSHEIVKEIDNELSDGYIVYTLAGRRHKKKLLVKHPEYLRLRSQLSVGKVVRIKYYETNSYIHDLDVILDVLPLCSHELTDVILGFTDPIPGGHLGENANKSYQEIIFQTRPIVDNRILYIPSDQVNPELIGNKCTVTYSFIGTPRIYGVTKVIKN